MLSDYGFSVSHNKREIGKEYYFFDGTFEIRNAIDEDNEVDRISYNIGNYFNNLDDCEIEVRFQKFFAKTKTWISRNCTHFDEGENSGQVYQIRKYNNGCYVQKIYLLKSSFDFGDFLLCFDTEDNATKYLEENQAEFEWYYDRYVPYFCPNIQFK